MDQDRALRLARSGLEEGFQWLFEHHRAGVFRFIRGLASLDRDEANDVLQNTFIRAFQHLDTLQDDNRYRSWLYQIARRETLRFIERKTHHREPREDELERACQQQAELEERAERERLMTIILEEASAIEPPAIRETALRYYLGEGRSTEEIARELQIPHATVRKRLFLFRNKLRDRLRSLG